MPLSKDATLLSSMSKKITALRKKRFPGHGGAGKCIAAFFQKSTKQITQAQRVKWNRWEKGKATPEESMQQQLAEFFGVTLAELRGEANESPPPAKAIRGQSAAMSKKDAGNPEQAEVLAQITEIAHQLLSFGLAYVRGEVSADRVRSVIEASNALLELAGQPHAADSKEDIRGTAG